MTGSASQSPRLALAAEPTRWLQQSLEITQHTTLSIGGTHLPLGVGFGPTIPVPRNGRIALLVPATCVDSCVTLPKRAAQRSTSGYPRPAPGCIPRLLSAPTTLNSGAHALAAMYQGSRACCAWYTP